MSYKNEPEKSGSVSIKNVDFSTTKDYNIVKVIRLNILTDAKGNYPDRDKKSSQHFLKS